MSNNDDNTQEPPSDFGIRLMDGEQVIFSLRPYRFIRFAVIAAVVTIVGIPLLPWALLWALIADVVISRTLPELLAGISSIDIRDMTGQSQMDRGLGAKWIGVKNGPDIQKRILEEIKSVNEHARKL